MFYGNLIILKKLLRNDNKEKFYCKEHDPRPRK